MRKIPLPRLLHGVAENLAIQGLLIAKVIIYGCDVCVGALAYFLDSRRFKTALRKNLAGCLKQTLTLVLGLFFPINGRSQFPCTPQGSKSESVM